MDPTRADAYFTQWNESENITVKMLSILNDLRVERGVLVHVCGRSIAKVSSVEILKVHRHARLVLGRELDGAGYPPRAAGRGAARPRAVPDRPGQAHDEVPGARGGAPVGGRLRRQGTGERVHRGARGPSPLAGRGALRLRPDRPASRPHPRGQDRARRQDPGSRRRGPPPEGERPQEAGGPVPHGLGARTLRGHHPDRRGGERHRRQRQPGPDPLRRGPGAARLHAVRHPGRHRRGQHGQVARSRRSGAPPRDPGREGGAPHRAGQGGHPQHRLRDQPRRAGPPGARGLGGLLHHQRHRAGPQGGSRALRSRLRPRGDGARLHQRPEPDRQLPQEGAPGALGGAQHGHHRDRGRQRRGEGAPGAGGQAHRQRHPRAHPGRVPGDPAAAPRQVDLEGGDQRLPAAHRARTAPCRTRSTSRHPRTS